MKKIAILVTLGLVLSILGCASDEECQSRCDETYKGTLQCRHWTICPKKDAGGDVKPKAADPAPIFDAGAEDAPVTTEPEPIGEHA